MKIIVNGKIDNQTTEAAVSNDKITEAQTGVNVEIIPSNVPDKATCELFGVKLRSECDYNLEAEITDLNAEFNKNDVLIFHTHTCESYTPTEQYRYESTGNYRTTDLNFSVSRVGDELEKYLSNYGYNVVHDKTYHDYPSYNGSIPYSIGYYMCCLPGSAAFRMHQATACISCQGAVQVRVWAIRSYCPVRLQGRYLSFPTLPYISCRTEGCRLSCLWSWRDMA